VNRYERDLPQIYLKPGEMHFADSPTLVVTVLGSCLSITMFSRKRGLAAICHGLLPQCGGDKNCNGECAEGFKYVDCAIRKMVRLFDKHKVKRSEIEVKCFGGADMFMREIQRPGVVSVGRQNVLTAERILKSEGLSMNVVDVGGLQGRKILFYTHSGEVYLKRLKKSERKDASL